MSKLTEIKIKYNNKFTQMLSDVQTNRDKN